jgi:hypothetical protein
MGLALNLRQIVGQLLQLDVVGNGPQFKHNAGTMEMRNSTDTGFVITRGSDPVGNNDYVTKGAGDLAYWRSVNPNWLVTDWYIDGVTGDDTNSGMVIGAPIKTGAELLRRLGPYAMWPQSVTVHVLANGMTDALVLRGLMMVAGNHLDVVGTPTVLLSSTVATYAARNHATPVAHQLTVTALADVTPYQWRRLRLTTGVNTGAVSWVACSNPAGVGFATARTSPWTNLVVNSATAYRTGTVVPAPGDGLNIESLPFVPSISIFLDSTRNIAAGFAWDKRFLSIQSISTQTLLVTGQAAFVYNVAPIFGCRISNCYLFDNNQNSLGIGTLTGCSFFWDDPVSTTYRLPKAVVEYGLFGEGTALATNTENSMYVSNVLFQGLLFQSGPLNFIQGTDVQIFDVPGAASVAFNWNQGRVSNLSGSGNAGYGIGLGNRVSLTFTGTINLQGTVSNGRLTVAPAISLTLPQLLQPSDYAQKGITPAMVAGTTTVTVPWYDNATQRVTVSHAAFAGTPGILSVQQISNTQFTITSSSALDTSTINWTISALGRNIFLSTV